MKWNSEMIKRGILEDRPEASARLRARLNAQLRAYTKEKPVRRTRFSTVLLAAVFCALLLAGAAFAGAKLGIFDYLSRGQEPIRPLEGAQEMILTKLGEAENADAVLSVEEAVFDGQGAIVQMRLAPKDVEHVALFAPFYQYAPEGDYVIERKKYVEGEDVDFSSVPEGAWVEEDASGKGDAWYCWVTGRRDGKQLIRYDLQVMAADGSFSLDQFDVREQADGSLIVWASGAEEYPIEDDLALLVQCGTYEGARLVAMPDIHLILTRATPEHVLRLEPEATEIGGRITLRSAELTVTKVRAYAAIEYEFMPTDEHEYDAGCHFVFLDASGRRLTGDNGSWSETKPGTEGAPSVTIETHEFQAFEQVPEELILAVETDQGKPLGRVRCRVAQD